MTAPTHILVVEDSTDDFALLCATLARQGVNAACVRVETAEQMRVALEQGGWQLVISDHHLPAFSSTQALRLLRSSDQELPFIIVSGTIGEDAAVAALHAGADDYLIKGRLTRLAAAVQRALAAAQERRDRKRAEAALAESEQKLRELSAHLQVVIDLERRAIAREIHDDIGSTLTALRFDLAWINRHGDAVSAQRAGQATVALNQIVAASQRIMHNLRPPVLDAGIVAALQWQVADFRKRYPTACKLQCNRDQLALSDRLAMTVFRTTQEALNNIVKHAQASSIAIDLVAMADQLSLEISDDGVGLAATDLTKATSFGLRGLAERASADGGSLDVFAGARGTTVLLHLPFGVAA
jgi:signal transduction histidine kinase